MIEAADETRDHAASANGETPVAAPSIPVEPAAAMVSDSAGFTSSAVAAMPSAGQVREFFSQLKISRAPSGNIVIEATEESASTLGALFQGMAELLNAVSGNKQ